MNWPSNHIIVPPNTSEGEIVIQHAELLLIMYRQRRGWVGLSRHVPAQVQYVKNNGGFSLPRLTYALASKSCDTTLPEPKFILPLYFSLLGGGPEPSFVEAEPTDPQFVVASVEFHSFASRVLSEWSQNVSLPSSDDLKVCRWRMKPWEVAPAKRGRSRGRQAPMIPSEDSTMGQYTRGVSA